MAPQLAAEACGKPAYAEPAGAARPLQRRFELTKQANSRFGADLCRINGRVYVLNVHEPPTPARRSTVSSLLNMDKSDAKAEQNAQQGQFAAHRLGLRRFDELFMIREECIATWNLEDIYNYLHRSSRMDVTVMDANITTQRSVPAAAVEGALANGTLQFEMEGNTDIRIVRVRSTSSLAAELPPTESIAEINGYLVLGMELQEVMAILWYACHESEDGVVTFSTVRPDYARAFLTALLLTADIYGYCEWKPTEVLRKSQEFGRKNQQARGMPVACAHSEQKCTSSHGGLVDTSCHRDKRCLTPKLSRKTSTGMRKMLSWGSLPWVRSQPSVQAV